MMYKHIDNTKMKIISLYKSNFNKLTSLEDFDGICINSGELSKIQQFLVFRKLRKAFPKPCKYECFY